MRHRLTTALTIAAVATVGATMIAPAATATPSPAPDSGTWCATASSPTIPCIVSASRDGVNVPDDGTYDIEVDPYSADGANSALWSVSQTDAAVTDPNAHSPGTFASLPVTETAHTWSLTMQLPLTPRVTFTYGAGVAITRQTNATNNTVDVTVTGKPVLTGVNDECTVSSWPWQCPQQSTANVTLFSGEITDFGQWNDPSERADFNGMDASTNVEESGLPPEVVGDPVSIVFDLANSHILAGQSQPFQGFFNIDIPNAFLVDMGIDDPSTLSSAGVSTSGSGGTTTVTPETGSTQVDVSGITFSPHKLKFAAGVITPTKPTSLRAKRTSGHKATLAFHRAKPRGSKLTGYQGRCSAKHYATVKATGKHTTLHLHGLAPGTAYQCQVRAKSKAGYGHWTAKKKLKK